MDKIEFTQVTPDDWQDLLKRFNHFHDSIIVEQSLALNRETRELDAILGLATMDDAFDPNYTRVDLKLSGITQQRCVIQENYCHVVVFEIAGLWHDGNVYVDVGGDSRDPDVETMLDSPHCYVGKAMYCSIRDSGYPSIYEERDTDLGIDPAMVRRLFD